jgi:hypothetical protein
MAPQTRRSSPKTAIRLRISLKEHMPAIWRRLLVPGEIKLSKLHSIFQAAMGWEDYHLHLLEIGDRTYGPPDDESDGEELDEDSVVFSELVEAPMRFSYSYDFGDDWLHEVVVESVEPVPLILKFATCVDGQRACPPEDCGGVGGFKRLVEALRNPDSSEAVDYRQWLGRPFDPEEFSVAATNAALQRVR